jgi:A/G-specific adenine glycosylase
MKRILAPRKQTAQSDSEQLADPSFSEDVIHWQKAHGRHDLPWQNTRDAYRVWLSEIMLQQTQVTAVIPYYLRFLQRFPDVQSLAAAPAEEVMAHWSGLGYYSRARNLHRCAQRVVAEYGGVFPADPALLADLPGIGRSTAAAIAAFSYGARAAILDGNVKRVFARVFGIDGYPGEKKVEDAMWQRAEALLPERDMEAYTQGLMDLGATVCTRGRPACQVCPLAQRCVAFNTLRTHELPTCKPKKSVPEKQTSMLIVIDRGEVLLQQRPPTGIWGGLLSLPEVDGYTTLNDDAEPMADLDRKTVERILGPYGELSSFERLPEVSHGFTHFKLYIAPYRVRLDRRLDMAADSDHVWYALDRLEQAPLPAPIKKLLLGLEAIQSL